MSAIRRLAAILAADVVGYTRLSELDEEGTLAALKQRRATVLRPLVQQHNGRIFNYTGDGVLVEFASAVNAVRCAIELQRGMADANDGVSDERRICLRVGVNLGDVIVEGKDLHGDGVIIAVRLQAMAAPNAICISRKVYDEVCRKVEAKFDDLGKQSLKNSSETLLVFSISLDPSAISLPMPIPRVLQLPAKPSLAILPFDNLSGDPGQQHVADGVVEDITSALSRVKSFFVIARSSTLPYRRPMASIKQIGRELGVRYLVVGSAQRVSDHVRINAQLIDATNGMLIWGDRYNGNVAEIFDLQDRITAGVVGAIEPQIRLAEIERARRKRPDSLEAYDYVMRAWPKVWALTPAACTEALTLLGEAMRLDPEYALPPALASWCHAQRVVYNWSEAVAEERAAGLELARAALALDSDDPVALTALGTAETVLLGDLDSAAIHVNKALALDPNLAWAWTRSGWIHAYIGAPAPAIEHFERALRLSPFDPLNFVCYHGIGIAHFTAERYGDATEWFEKGLRERPALIWQHRALIPCYALQGRLDDARAGIALLLRHQPNLSISAFARMAVPFKRADVQERFLIGLRKAGMPE